MTGAERVIFAFTAARKTGNAIRLAQRLHFFAAPRQDFMRVGLVADIPDQFVIGCVEHVMQCDGEFYHTEVGGQMSAGSGNTFNQKRTQLFSQLYELSALQQA